MVVLLVENYKYVIYIYMTIFKNFFKCTSSAPDDTEYTKLQLKIEALQQDIIKLFSQINNITNQIDILIINLKLKN